MKFMNFGGNDLLEASICAMCFWNADSCTGRTW